MPITNSRTGDSQLFSVSEIEHRIARMRAHILTAITCAQSGHPGGSLSVAEIVGTLFLSSSRVNIRMTVMAMMIPAI